MREASFLSGGAPHGGALVLIGVFEKNHRIGGGGTPPHTMGNSDFLGNIPLVTLMDQ